MSLTPAINLTYANPIAAQSASRFRILSEQERSGAQLKRFFCAHTFSMVGCVGAASVAPALLPGNANPAQPATLLLRINHGGSSQQQEIIIMSALFVLRDGISPQECREQIHFLNEQALVLIDSITAYTECRNTLTIPENFQAVGWLLWTLGELLERQNALCERSYDFKLDDSLTTKMESSI